MVVIESEQNSDVTDLTSVSKPDTDSTCAMAQMSSDELNAVNASSRFFGNQQIVRNDVWLEQDLF
jgi:hypothetical protein